MGALPFKDTAELLHGKGNTILAELPCSVWPLSAGRSTASGEAYDWTGEAPAEHADKLVANRSLKLADGRYLKIVGAARHTILPHVALLLRETKAGG